MPTDFQAWDSIQERARRAILNSFRDVNCLAATAPTGFGKTRLGANLLRKMDAKGYKWVWYTHRKTLTTQTMRSFNEQGLDFGVRASGLADEMDLSKSGQIAMVQSEAAAVKAGTRGLHEARFVVIDEAHANKEGFADTLIKWHLEQGAKVLLLTATPVGLRRAERLIRLSSLSEMRGIGALLTAIPYTVPGQDMKLVRKISSGDFGTKQQAIHFTQQQVVGNILHHYRRLQRHHFPLVGAPGLGFAPCVKSSISMTDQFCAAGVKSAHIDGEDVYLGEHDLNGNPIIYKSSQKMRDYVFDSIKARDIRFVWNRFVMREGVDIPELGHAVFACAFGNPETWVQACGRVLRAHDSLCEVVIQDHGANISRPGLGSPNLDRDWTLETTNESLVKESKEARKNGEEKSPTHCPNPKCNRAINYEAWLANDKSCPHCGTRFKRTSTDIIQADGTLVRHYDKAEKKPVADFQKAWTGIYFAMKNSRDGQSTFNQLAAAFERACPVYRVDKSNGTVRHRDTGQVFQLGFCPLKSHWWDLSVKTVNNSALKFPAA
jgi:superfamily II DNA or RNA helicase